MAAVLFSVPTGICDTSGIRTVPTAKRRYLVRPDLLIRQHKARWIKLVDEFERYLALVEQKARDEAAAADAAMFAARVNTVTSILDASRGQPLSDDLITRIKNVLSNSVQPAQEDT